AASSRRLSSLRHRGRASSPATPGGRNRGRVARVSRVPILCYHNVGPRPPGTRLGLLYVGSAQFERQLWILRKLGLSGVAMSEGFAQMRDLARSDRVVLTFDDGYVDTLTEAAPILARYGFRATCYIVS